LEKKKGRVNWAQLQPILGRRTKKFREPVKEVHPLTAYNVLEPLFTDSRVPATRSLNDIDFDNAFEQNNIFEDIDANDETTYPKFKRFLSSIRAKYDSERVGYYPNLINNPVPRLQFGKEKRRMKHSYLNY